LNDYWFHQLQPHLARLSSRGELVAQSSAEEPASIIRAVDAVVTQVCADKRSGPQISDGPGRSR
jgi:hypothetical protein